MGKDVLGSCKQLLNPGGPSNSYSVSRPRPRSNHLYILASLLVLGVLFSSHRSGTTATSSSTARRAKRSYDKTGGEGSQGKDLEGVPWLDGAFLARSCTLLPCQHLQLSSDDQCQEWEARAAHLSACEWANVVVQ